MRTIACLEESEFYTLISGRLYRQGADQILRLCLDPEQFVETMDEAHVSLDGLHASEQQTTQRILLNGF